MTDDSLYDCLACAPHLLGQLDRHPQLAARWQTLPRREYAAGQPLLMAGQAVERVWFIARGLVRVAHLSAQGVERNAAFHAEGSWVGWGTPPFATTSPVDIFALEPTQVLELSYAELRLWQAELPLVQELLSDAIRAVLARSAQREAELLLLDAEARYRAFLEQRGELVERIPLHHVASYLGITNVALSRIRARMGLVRGRR